MFKLSWFTQSPELVVYDYLPSRCRGVTHVMADSNGEMHLERGMGTVNTLRYFVYGVTVMCYVLVITKCKDLTK